MGKWNSFLSFFEFLRRKKGKRDIFKRNLWISIIYKKYKFTDRENKEIPKKALNKKSILRHWYILFHNKNLLNQ